MKQDINAMKVPVTEKEAEIMKLNQTLENKSNVNGQTDSLFEMKDNNNQTLEPQHDKTNYMACCPAKTQS